MEFEISLESLIGKAYIDAVVSAASQVQGRPVEVLRGEASESISFGIDEYFSRCDRVLDFVGSTSHKATGETHSGAGTDSFACNRRVWGHVLRATPHVAVKSREGPSLRRAVLCSDEVASNVRICLAQDN